MEDADTEATTTSAVVETTVTDDVEKKEEEATKSEEQIAEIKIAEDVQNDDTVPLTTSEEVAEQPQTVVSVEELPKEDTPVVEEKEEPSQQEASKSASPTTTPRRMDTLDIKESPGHRRASQLMMVDPADNETLRTKVRNTELLNDIATGVRRLRKSVVQATLEMREQLPLVKLRVLHQIERADRKSVLHPVNPDEHKEDENMRADALEKHWHMWHETVVRIYHALSVRTIDVRDEQALDAICRKLTNVPEASQEVEDASARAARERFLALWATVHDKQGKEGKEEQNKDAAAPKGIVPGTIDVFIFERYLSNLLLMGEAPTPEQVNGLSKRAL